MLTEPIDLVYRRRELKLKENAATSRIRLVAIVASKTGTNSRSDALLLATPLERFDATIGLSSPRGEQARALEECKR